MGTVWWMHLRAVVYRHPNCVSYEGLQRHSLDQRGPHHAPIACWEMISGNRFCRYFREAGTQKLCAAEGIQESMGHGGSGQLQIGGFCPGAKKAATTEGWPSWERAGSQSSGFSITKEQDHTPLCQPLLCPLAMPCPDWVVNGTHLTLH